MGAGASVSRQQWENADNSNQQQSNDDSLVTDMAGMAKLMEAKNKFMKNKKKNTACFQKELASTDLIKEMFKRMDPAVTQADSGDIKGDIELSLKYNQKEELLLVKVIRARDLVARDLNGKSDPYVVLDIVPDRFEEGSKKTRFKQKTLNPVFNEIFQFKLPHAHLSTTKLKATIWDHDFFGEDDFNGEAVIDLSRVYLSAGTHTDWYMLQLQTDFSITGTLDVTLEHQDSENMLLVTINSAANLKASNTLSNTSDAYVRCSVSGLKYSEETAVVSGTLHPVFEETFEFDMAKEEIPSRAVLFHVFGKSHISDHMSLGQVHIELDSLDLEDGEISRKVLPLADLKNVSLKRAEWAQNAVAQEFREAMYAHAMYKYPTFVYGMHKKGRKLYSVSSRNAASSAKVLLVNGIPM
ncbi:synaptotagmin-10 [Exaiptasia diaphana]|uniref:C2 domain-containing protein n=1 Tax=Exaiptasia diaphana TaxID=2652724 RepID=A0A913YB79_EXADI|nr:synaptotagmin-10 [Exaiptasia diaphana]KXJ21251.1 Synaptotagmin-3 [Exaiptasia diaphana]